MWKLPFPKNFAESPLLPKTEMPSVLVNERRLILLKKSLPRLALLSLLALLTLVILQAVSARLETYHAVKTIRAETEKTAALLVLVDERLRGLYIFVSGKEIAYDPSLASLWETTAFSGIVNGVLGTWTARINPTQALLKEKLLLLKAATSPERTVLDKDGPSGSPTDATSPAPVGDSPLTRQARLAALTTETINEAITQLMALKRVLYQKSAGEKWEKEPFLSLKNRLAETLADSGSFLDEAKRTADYYNLISDIQASIITDLATLTETLDKLVISKRPYLYLVTLDRTREGFARARLRLEAVNGEDLPFGFTPLHEDNLKTLILLNETTAEAVKLIKNQKESEFNALIIQLNKSLDETAARAGRLESSFWENNLKLWSVANLKPRYESLTKDLKKLEAQTRLPR